MDAASLEQGTAPAPVRPSLEPCRSPQDLGTQDPRPAVWGVSELHPPLIRGSWRVTGASTRLCWAAVYPQDGTALIGGARTPQLPSPCSPPGISLIPLPGLAAGSETCPMPQSAHAPGSCWQPLGQGWGSPGGRGPLAPGDAGVTPSHISPAPSLALRPQPHYSAAGSQAGAGAPARQGPLAPLPCPRPRPRKSCGHCRHFIYLFISQVINKKVPY